MHARSTGAGPGPCRITSPAPRSVWDAVYRSDPEAVPYQSSQWTDAICASGTHVDRSRAYEMSDGRTLVLPLLRRSGLPDRLAPARSMPSGLGMGGLVGEGITPRDVRIVVADLATLPFPMVAVRPNPRTGMTWSDAAPLNAERLPRRAHVVDLSLGEGWLWTGGLSKSISKLAAKARRQGLGVRWESSPDRLSVFLDLYDRSVVRWARRQHEPLSLSRWRMRRANNPAALRAALEVMDGVCRIGVVEIDGQPAAAALVFIEPGGNANGVRQAMDTEIVRRTGAGYLLQVSALEEAMRAGCRHFHLGESGQAAGLSDHKERMGGEPSSYAEVQMGRIPIGRADRALRSTLKRAIGFRDASRNPAKPEPVEPV